MASPTIYLIRHGEKPPKVEGKHGKMHDQPGLLDPEGINRSKGLVDVFGSSSKYDIKFILAQDHTGEEGERPYLTIQPLVESLGDSIQTNFTIPSDDASAVNDAVNKFTGPGNVLICWEHGNLTSIATALGVSDKPEYPDSRFDLIWTVQDSKLTNVTSEQCVYNGVNLDAEYAKETWTEEGNGEWVSSMGQKLEKLSVVT